MGKKSNHKKKKRKKARDQTYFGFPWMLIQKQPPVRAGSDFKCERCGVYHVLQDGSRDFPEAREGDVLVYQCCERWLIGGVKGYSVVNLEDKLPHNYRMAFLLADMVHIFMPVAAMAVQAEKNKNDDGLLETGREVLPVSIPLPVARQIRYVIAKSNKLLNELKFVETVNEPRIELEEQLSEGSKLWLPEGFGDVSISS